jgi:hypothetical protein
MGEGQGKGPTKGSTRKDLISSDFNTVEPSTLLPTRDRFCRRRHRGMQHPAAGSSLRFNKTTAGEFAAEFDQTCPSNSACVCSCCRRVPQAQRVERSNRTHTEEFWHVTPCSLEMKKLDRELRDKE